MMFKGCSLIKISFEIIPSDAVDLIINSSPIEAWLEFLLLIVSSTISSVGIVLYEALRQNGKT